MALPRQLLRRILHEPLLQFLLAGGVLFLCSSMLSSAPSGTEKHIEVSPEQLARLVQNFRAFAGREPNAEELQLMVEDHVVDEIMYREALARGLDQEDTVIRDRLRQKLEFLCEEAAVVETPTDEQLQQYLTENAGYFSLGPQISFKQVFFSRVDRPATALNDAKVLLETLRANPDPDISREGDPTPFPTSFNLASFNRVKALFGDLLLEKLEQLETGRWWGPLESDLGIHLVYISERKPGHTPKLEEVREQVRLEWLAERKLEARDAALRALRDSYTVAVAPYTPAPPQEPPPASVEEPQS